MLKFSVFISYSQADGKKFVSDLPRHISEKLPNFELSYDKHIDLGDKIWEDIRKKIARCDILVVIITDGATQSTGVKREIRLAKENNRSIIPLKYKYVKLDWKEFPCNICEYKGEEFENYDELKEILVYTLRKRLSKLELESKSSLLIQTDRSIYIRNSDMIYTVITPNLSSQKPISIKIVDKSKNEIYQKRLENIPNGDGIYRQTIHLGGGVWPTSPSSELTIIVEHEDKTAERTFFLTNSGVAIKLNHKVYTWTDKVRITIAAPNFNKDPNKIGRIGNNEDGIISIKTGMGKIGNYELIEAGPNTGIFIGEIGLTGFQHSEFPPDIVNGFGRTSGKGPKDGCIGTDSDDKLVVEFKTKNETITASALIRLNIGDVQWMQDSYSLGDTGVLKVIDPDMNLDPDSIDTFKVRVWSDSDRIGTEISVVETGCETGIFFGNIQFGTKTEEGKMIKVSTKDSVKVEYVDYTLPSPYSKKNKLIITAESIIGTRFNGPLLPSHKRIIIENPRVVDSSGNTIKKILSNQEIQIVADLTNIQRFEQEFLYIVKILNSEDREIYSKEITGSISSNQSFTPVVYWKPVTAGQYTATILIWKSMDDPVALSTLTNMEIIVMPSKNS